MRGRGASVGAFALTIGVVLAGGIALRPVASAQSAAILDTTPTEDATASVSVADPVAVASAPTVTVAEILPTPVAAPASVVFPEMKHVWQSLNNCGPAAVVMALSTFGVDANQEAARLALRGPDVRRGMGPQGVGPWVKENFDLRSTWRNGGTIETIKALVANGFAPMVTQWMQDPWVSRIAHWRTVRGYDDAKSVFYVNDSMLGNMVPLSYEWFGRNWQSFSYRYMVIYKPEDEKLLNAIMGPLSYEWFGRNWQSFSYRYMVIYKPEDEKLLNAIMGPQVSDAVMRRDLYQRAKTEALTQNTNFAWLAYGEAAYSYGMFEEAVMAFEKGLSMGSPNGVFGLRNSYPQALRALGRQQDAERAAQQLNNISIVPSSTVVAPPDPYALYLAMLRITPFEQIPTE